MNKQIPNIIVTGGCGFIGSHLVERLLAEGFFVTVIDDRRAGHTIVTHPNVLYIFEDVGSFNPFVSEIDPPVAIFHLANSPRVRRSLDYPTETIVNNIVTTATVCDWARVMNSRLFFATSSSTKYIKESRNPYTWSKYACEDMLSLYKDLYGLEYTKMFFYNVYGPREADYGEYSTVIRKFKQDYLQGKSLTVFGTGAKERDFTHVYDVVQGLLDLLIDENWHESVHLGKGSPQTIQSIAEEFNTSIVYSFDKEGEAQRTRCERPYTECPTNVHTYIRNWVQENSGDRQISR